MGNLTQQFERLADKLSEALYRPRWYAASAAIFLLWLLSSSIGADPDLFARVAAGRLFASTGSVPLHDPFAFTPKLPMWVDHEWLSGLVFYAVSRHGGDLGLFLFKIVFACLSLFVLFSASRIALKG